MKANKVQTVFLADVPLFSALSEPQVEQIQQGMNVIKLKKSESLFTSDQVADRFFVVFKGQIKLFIPADTKSEKVIEIVHPGESIAIAVMFMEQKHYPVCAEALQDSRVLSFQNVVFLDILRKSPQTCFRVMADMSRRLRRQITEIDQLTLSCAPRRVAAYLLEKTPKEGPSTGHFLLDVPKQTIASLLSIQPETLSRILKTLSKKGLIYVNSKSIHINDVTALKVFIDEGACRSHTSGQC